MAFLIFFFCVNSFGQKAKKLKRKELKLIEEKLPYEPFEVLTIENKKDSIFLRKQSKKVNLDKNKNEAIYFSKRLLKTVQDPKNMGVGIAAPQVGLQRQIILVQRFDKANEPFEIYINPIIKSCSDEQKLGKEGCLSIPNYTAEVFRPIKIVVEYVDLDGKKHIEEISGFTSVIFQHEIDHLNGILFTDHLQSE
ncbi:peptide deformylase [Salibacteraceae bacterium]|nr:peptide deformylase [Salibacteraceae bacterium]MDA9967961.1 peptide deformylase [Salibacteraceae bacterium]